MKFNLLTVACLGLFAFTGCTEDTNAVATPLADESISFIHDEGEDGYTAIGPTSYDDALRDHAATTSEDYFNAERKEVTRPDGTTETVYVVGGDIELSKEELTKLQQMDDAMLKQYRTFNLVNIGTINVVGYTGGRFALTEKMRTSLTWAIANYNRININKQFNLRFGGDTNGDIVVYRDPDDNGAGGSAGFPSDGRPFKFVRILSGMERFDTNTNEHVMTHEIGHCMGLRHTDWQTRQSCSNGRGEGALDIGAVYIPGTPGGFDANSVMLSCFGNEDGEFGQFDVIALERLY